MNDNVDTVLHYPEIGRTYLYIYDSQGLSFVERYEGMSEEQAKELAFRFDAIFTEEEK